MHEHALTADSRAKRHAVDAERDPGALLCRVSTAHWRVLAEFSPDRLACLLSPLTVQVWQAMDGANRPAGADIRRFCKHLRTCYVRCPGSTYFLSCLALL